MLRGPETQLPDGRDESRDSRRGRLRSKAGSLREPRGVVGKEVFASTTGRLRVAFVVPPKNAGVGSVLAPFEVLSKRCDVTTVGSVGEFARHGSVNIEPQLSFDRLSAQDVDVMVVPGGLRKSGAYQWLKALPPDEFPLVVRAKNHLLTVYRDGVNDKSPRLALRSKTAVDESLDLVDALYQILGDAKPNLPVYRRRSTATSAGSSSPRALSRSSSAETPPQSAPPTQPSDAPGDSIAATELGEHRRNLLDARLERRASTDSLRVLSHSVTHLFRVSFVGVLLYRGVDEAALAAALDVWAQVAGVQLVPLQLNPREGKTEGGHGLALSGPRSLRDFAAIPDAVASLRVLVLPPRAAGGASVAGPAPKPDRVRRLLASVSGRPAPCEVLDQTGVPASRAFAAQLDAVERLFSLAVARSTLRKLAQST